MRLRLLTGFLLLALLSQAQEDNSDPVAKKYETLKLAVERKAVKNSHVTVAELGVGGDFVVKLRADGFTPDGGYIIAMKDSISVLVRDISNATDIPITWWGIKGDGVTDNYAMLNYLLSTACPFSHFFVPVGNYYSSGTVVPHKIFSLHGRDAYEMPTVQTYFTFPQGVNGFLFNDVNCAGSIMSGFEVVSTRPAGGRIMEYNPTDGRALIISPLGSPTLNIPFQFMDPYEPQTVKGTATFTDAGINDLVASVSYTRPAGSFVVGETITGGTSGAHAVVKFVSRYYNASVVGTITGTFTLGETLTGSSSGATAQYLSTPGTRFAFARVAQVTNVSGVIDGIDVAGYRQNIFIESGKYSTGIVINRRITLEDISVLNFGGNGIEVTSLTTPVSNANLVRLNRVRLNVNGANGLKVEGGDANAITVSNSTFVNNNGWAVCDLSFLGITVQNTHSSANLIGAYTSGNYINRRTLWDNVYSEGGYILSPWPDETNYIAGGAGMIGGTHGQANVTPVWSTTGNGGYAFDIDHARNNFFYTNPNTTTPGMIFKGAGTTPVPLIVENTGNSGVGRGPAIGFWGPVASGYQGPEIKNTSTPYAQLQSALLSTGQYGFAFQFRRNAAPAITVTGGSGTGAVLIPNILNGAVTSVSIMASGKKYPTNGTTATMAAPAGGTAATFNVVVSDSSISLVQVLTGGSGYNDNDMYSAIEMDANATFRPTTTATGSLGDATHHWKSLFVDSIISNVAGVGPINNQNTSLQAGNFYIGGSGSIITNHNAVPVTTISGITNPGLSIVSRAADGYQTALHVYQSGNSSGMSLSSYAANTGIISVGGYYNKLTGGITGGFMPLETSMSAFVQQNGGFTFENALGLTPGTLAQINRVLFIDANGISYSGFSNTNTYLGLRANSTAMTALAFNLAGAALKTTTVRGGMEAVSNSLYYTDSNAVRYKIPLVTNTTPVNGAINIWNGTAYVADTLKAGANISITRGAGSITINSTASGTGGSSNYRLPYDGNSAHYLGGDTIYHDFPSTARAAISLNLTATGTSGAATGTYNATTGVISINVPQYTSGTGGGGAESDPVYAANGVTTNTFQVLTAPKTFPASTAGTPSLVLANSGTNYVGSTAGALWTYNQHVYAMLNGVATQIDHQAFDTSQCCTFIANTTGLQVGANMNISGSAGVGTLFFNQAPATGSANDNVLTVSSSGTVGQVSVASITDAVNTVTVASSSYTVPNVAGSKTVVLVNYSAGSATVVLPSAAANADKEVVIKDITTQSVTISGGWVSDANTIASFSYGAYTWHSNGTTWYMIAKM